MPVGEVPGAVQEGHDSDLVREHAIHEPISEDKQFPQGGVLQFWNDSTAIGKRVKGCRGFERPEQHLDGLVSGVLSNVGDDVVERGGGGVRPDYCALPRSHLRRNSASTCPWGTV